MSEGERSVLILRQLLQWAVAAVLGAALCGAVAVISLTYVIPRLEQAVFEGTLTGLQSYSIRFESEGSSLTLARDGDAIAAAEEVWLVMPGQTPVSLGLLGPRGRLDVDLSGFSLDQVAQAGFAVTAEAEGGAPEGMPSDDILAVGTFDRR
ncbi:MAG: hypothetical protein AAGA15_06055 [Pseudomonadota bacterium]